jgi:hypothetical protein
MGPLTTTGGEAIGGTGPGPLTTGGFVFEGSEHQAFKPLWLPSQVHDVEAPLFTDPVKVPAVQLLGDVPQAPLTGGGTSSGTLHQVFFPLCVPLQVQDVEIPLSLVS